MVRRAVVLFLCLQFLSSQASIAWSKSNKPQPPKSGQMTDSEEIQDSIVRWKSAAEANPKNPENHSHLGRAYLMSGNLDGAIEEFKTATKLKVDDQASYKGLARAYMRKGMADEARQALNEAIKLDPKDSEPHVKMGQLLIHEARKNPDLFDQAIKEFQLATKANDSDALAHQALGAAYGMKGDLDGEITEERRALALDSRDGDTFYYLGSATLYKGNDKEATDLLQKCVAIDAKNADAHRLLAGLFAADGKYDDAIHHARTACGLAPDDKACQATLSKILTKAKKGK